MIHGGVHPFDGGLRLWWGETRPGRSLARPSSPNLFRPIRADGQVDIGLMYRAGGLIEADGEIERSELHRLMRRLCERVTRHPGPERENAALPAGYTYLLQFVAHDMVDTLRAAEAFPAEIRPDPRNVRSRPLMLDTLYGHGPDECPQAYAIHELPGDDAGRTVRTKLRLGPRRKAVGFEAQRCPYRDIARAAITAAYSDDAALLEASGARLPDPLLSEPLLADPRNDSHALVSQLTVLFALLHNEIVACLEAIPVPELADPHVPGHVHRLVSEHSQRLYLCARYVVTDIYRTIIREDVLSRILDPRVLKRYRDEGKPLLDGAEGIPLEFTFGAFRFGHAMVRANYTINDTALRSTSAAVQISSDRDLSRLPLDDTWLVDWARFFEGGRDGIRPNSSRRIGPSYTSALESPAAFGNRVPQLDMHGLMFRDMVSSCFAGVLSVRALCDKLGGVFGEDLVGDFASWRDRIAAELARKPWPMGDDNQGEIDAIADDPPLPFFFLFEAIHAERGGAALDGAHLGPIGSIVVAETFWGAFAAHPLGSGDAALPMSERISRYAESFFPDTVGVAGRAVAARASLATVAAAQIGSMPALLAFLESRGCFTPPQGP
jgi:hypothetical protein